MTKMISIPNAIRAGAALTQQQHGSIFGDVEGGGLATCALGSLYFAVNGMSGLYGQWNPGQYQQLMAIDTVSVACPAVDCPGTAGFHLSAGSIIAHLNDHHRWTRQHIADWLDMTVVKNMMITVGNTSPIRDLSMYDVIEAAENVAEEAEPEGEGANAPDDAPEVEEDDIISDEPDDDEEDVADDDADPAVMPTGRVLVAV